MNKVIANYISDLKVGDEILVGRFKNKRAKIKGFGLDEKKHPIVKTNKGDYKIFTFRISREEGFSSVGLLILLAIGFLVVVLYSRSFKEDVATTKNNLKPAPGSSGPEMVNVVREAYLKKCTAPAGEKNFFTTCIGVRPEDCPDLVEDIIKSAQKMMGKPYVHNGHEVIVTKFVDAIEVSAFERTAPDNRRLPRCQRNP